MIGLLPGDLWISLYAELDGAPATVLLRAGAAATAGIDIHRWL